MLHAEGFKIERFIEEAMYKELPWFMKNVRLFPCLRDCLAPV